MESGVSGRLRRGRLLLAGFSLLGLLCVLPACVAGCFRREESIVVEGERRYYRLHVPGDVASRAPVPVLFALHQFSDTDRGMERLTGFNDLADAEGFIVVYPQGRFRVWNTGGERGEADLRFLEQLLDHVAGRYPVDLARVYATGASAGGMMAQYWARRSQRVAAIAPVMGSMSRGDMEADPPASGRPVPVLILHGDRDPVVPYNGGDTYAGPGRTARFLSAPENAAYWATRNGCAEQPETERLPDADPGDGFGVTLTRWSCPETAPVMLYTVEGGGHTWPGRKNWYPAFIVGPVAPEPDASQLIWDFLRQFRLNAPSAAS
ncbi:MAG TPA: PHB depolymerase family esterase [Candidatus Hydrogenedentes bacterium]|nr:PHB depolymerase family esterase [Candidatus Hydrogenedentota bacterium]